MKELEIDDYIEYTEANIKVIALIIGATSFNTTFKIVEVISQNDWDNIKLGNIHSLQRCTVEKNSTLLNTNTTRLLYAI